jgi:predicted MPP superfamily phosphohydrolase
MLYLYENTPFFVLLNHYYVENKNAQKTAEEILNENMMVQAVELTKTELDKAKKYENEWTIAWKRNYFYEAIMHDEIYTISELDDITKESCPGNGNELKNEWVCVDNDEKLIEIIEDMWVYDNE